MAAIGMCNFRKDSEEIKDSCFFGLSLRTKKHGMFLSTVIGTGIVRQFLKN